MTDPYTDAETASRSSDRPPLPREAANYRMGELWTIRPIGCRQGAAVAGLITWCAAMMLPLETAHAQTLSFLGGISSSWGESSEIICTLECGRGSIIAARRTKVVSPGLAPRVGSFNPCCMTDPYTEAETASRSSDRPIPPT